MKRLAHLTQMCKLIARGDAVGEPCTHSLDEPKGYMILLKKVDPLCRKRAEHEYTKYIVPKTVVNLAADIWPDKGGA